MLITLPLELVLDARVYRRPRRLVAALWLPVVLFALWDVVAIARRHWRYAADYVTGWTVPPNLPIEELLFFIVIPTCALLTFEAVGRILARRHRADGPGDEA